MRRARHGPACRRREDRCRRSRLACGASSSRHRGGAWGSRRTRCTDCAHGRRRKRCPPDWRSRAVARSGAATGAGSRCRIRHAGSSAPGTVRGRIAHSRRRRCRRAARRRLAGRIGMVGAGPGRHIGSPRRALSRAGARGRRPRVRWDATGFDGRAISPVRPRGPPPRHIGARLDGRAAVCRARRLLAGATLLIAARHRRGSPPVGCLHLP
jgi:hypothetical protein